MKNHLLEEALTQSNNNLKEHRHINGNLLQQIEKLKQQAQGLNTQKFEHNTVIKQIKNFENSIADQEEGYL